MRTRTVLTRTLLPVLAAGALAGAFVAGTSVGPPPPGGGSLVGPAPAPLLAAAGTSVDSAGSCTELLDWYVDRAVGLVGPYGWETGSFAFPEEAFFGTADAEAGVAARSSVPAAAPGTERATNGANGTNVQESGVDEPDVVKTDGELLVRIRHDELTTYDVGPGAAGEAPQLLGTLDLAMVGGSELLLSGDTVVVVAGVEQASDPMGRSRGLADDEAPTTVLTVDVSDPAAPRLTSTTAYDARLLGARLHGDTVRLALAAGLPDLGFTSPHPRRGRDEEEAERRNQELVRATTIEDWLPGATVEGETAPLLDCDAIALPEDDSGLDTLAVVGFDAAAPQERSVQGLAAAADVAYFSADHLYLVASHGERWEDGWWGGQVPDELAGTTSLHDLALSGTSTTYVASGTVEGSVADRWALDEHDGVLRLAVGPSSRTGDHNAVLTLRRDGTTLVEAGRVDRLGVGEQIESVRWFEGLAIVVTFRQVDPLYAVDLTDADAPRLMGELKIPGFSEYLHPLGSQRLIGVGQGPQADPPRRGGPFGGWGAQVGLFDVTDLTRPRRIDVLGYGASTQAGAAHDPRQLTWLPATRTVLTVVSTGWGSGTTWVSVLQLGGGELRNRMVEVEHGTDGQHVRTVPLPDGRVVLVTGDAVSYFDV